MGELWCLAGKTLGLITFGLTERIELSCDRLEHQDGELHWDKTFQVWWLDAPELDAHLSMWGTGHSCDAAGPHESPCVCECGVPQPASSQDGKA